MPSNHLFSALATTLLISSGCANEEVTDLTPESAVSHELVQLASLRSHTGTTVELYTSGHGYLAVEYGASELPRALDHTAELTLADVYRDATHSMDVPAKIAAASGDRSWLACAWAI